MKNNSNINIGNWLKVSDVAAYLNVSRSFVYKLTGSGELRSVKLGRAIRVLQVDLDNYIRSGLSPSKFGES